MKNLNLIVNKYRTKAPLVQCITNHVVSNFTANVLIASGASPAMVDVPKEAGAFARIASGLLINVGTPDLAQQQAIPEAIAAAHYVGTPWVLDPVAVGALSVRTSLAKNSLEYQPHLIRGNASEIRSLAEFESQSKGVDSQGSVEEAIEAAQELNAQHGSIVAISGEVDHIIGADQLVKIHQGTRLLTQVTGGGCALGAVYAGFLGVHDHTFEAIVAATAFYTMAAERAAAKTKVHGPGSFSVAFLDELSTITPEDVQKATIS